MIEYRTERLDPATENEVTRILSTFGWQLVSSQEIYNESIETTGASIRQSGHIALDGSSAGDWGSNGNIKFQQHKTVTNYVTVKYARDTSMPNYEKLKALGEDFEDGLATGEPKMPVKRTAVAVIGILIIVISIILAIVEHNSAELWEIGVCVIFSIVMIPVTILGWKSYKRNLANYHAVQTHMQVVYEEALTLIN